MEKMIVIVFDNEQKALEGLEGIRWLDSDGTISVYGTQTVVKQPDGFIRVVDNPDLAGFPVAPAGGAAVGAIVGLLGGPVGVPVGAAAGATIGAIGDMEDAGVTDAFINEIGKALTPGKAAIVANIAEEFVTPLDARMERSGGVVFRQMRYVAENMQDDRDAAAHQAEMEQLKVERAQARSDRLAKIDARIDHLRVKLENAIERKRIKMRLREQEREAKVKALQTKADRSEGEVRRRQEARIAELRHDYAEKAGVR
jgi:uncharacterized membrane protein